MNRAFDAVAISLVVALCSIVNAQVPPANVELQLRASEMVNGVPEIISFVFLNRGQEVRVPPVSPCFGDYSGMLILHFEFVPAPPVGPGVGGGCGGGADHIPPILDQVKSWRRLQPGESFTATYKRAELFAVQQGPGEYDFWGEYQPPRLSAEELSALEKARITVVRQSLISAHLRFKSPR